MSNILWLTCLHDQQRRGLLASRLPKMCKMRCQRDDRETERKPEDKLLTPYRRGAHCICHQNHHQAPSRRGAVVQPLAMGLQ